MNTAVNTKTKKRLEGTDYIAVSYTHLDVYKRQVPSVLPLMYRCNDVIREDLLLNIFLQRSSMSVSYTHLDVYKRQVYIYVGISLTKADA